MHLRAVFISCSEKPNLDKKDLLLLIKRRSKVHQKNEPCEHTLNFDKWKTFTENYKPMKIMVCLQNKLAIYPLHKKWSFPLKISSVNVTKQQFSTDLVTFTEEILIGKLQIFCSDLISATAAFIDMTLRLS